MQTSDIKNVSSEIEKGMQERARATGSAPVQHVADVLKTQHEMMIDKKLIERTKRIARYLEDIKRQSPKDFERTQRQVESLRPLLRLSLRSVNFRETLLSFLRVFKHVFEQNVDGSMEEVLATGEQQGWQQAGEAARRIGERTWDKARQSNRKVISDEDWKKLTDQLNKIFSDLHQHPNYQAGISALFDIPSTLASEIKENKPEGPTEKLKEESKDLIAQFSGREILDRLFDKIQNLVNSLENNQEAKNWWKEFKSLSQKIAEEYSDQQDFDELRNLFNRGGDILDSYRPQINDIIDMISDIFDKMSNDEYVKDLQERLSIVADDLYWVDSEGNKRLDVDAVGDISAAIGELLRQQLSHFNLGDITRDKEDIRYRLTNLNINATIPEKVRLHMESDAVLDTSKSVEDRRFKSEVVITASIKGVRMVAKGINFWYESPTLSESGVMDVVIPSADLCIDFVYTPSEPVDKSGFCKEVGGSRSFYQFLRVRTHFSVSDLDITYDTTTLKHSILVPILTRLFKPYLVLRFESGIQDSMNQGLRQLGEKISDIMRQSPYNLSLGGDWSSLGGLGQSLGFDETSKNSEKQPLLGDERHTPMSVEGTASPKTERQWPKTTIH